MRGGRNNLHGDCRSTQTVGYFDSSNSRTHEGMFWEHSQSKERCTTPPKRLEFAISTNSKTQCHPSKHEHKNNSNEVGDRPAQTQVESLWEIDKMFQEWEIDKMFQERFVIRRRLHRNSVSPSYHHSPLFVPPNHEDARSKKPEPIRKRLGNCLQ